MHTNYKIDIIHIIHKYGYNFHISNLNHHQNINNLLFIKKLLSYYPY